MGTRIVKVTSKGQVTIPKGMREQLGISDQDRLLFAVEGDRLIATPVRQTPLGELYGALPATKPYPGHDKVRQKLRRGLGKRISEGEE